MFCDRPDGNKFILAHTCSSTNPIYCGTELCACGVDLLGAGDLVIGGIFTGGSGIQIRMISSVALALADIS